MAGPTHKTRTQLSALRMELAEQLGLRKPTNSLPFGVDFPLLEWDEETERYHAMHHPLLRLNQSSSRLLDEPGAVNAKLMT